MPRTKAPRADGFFGAGARRVLVAGLLRCLGADGFLAAGRALLPLRGRVCVDVRLAMAGRYRPVPAVTAVTRGDTPRWVTDART
jgi:hypothetical protein